MGGEALAWAPRCPRAGASSAWRPALAEARPRSATGAVIDQHQVVPEPKTVAQRSPRLRALVSSSFTSICACRARSRSMAQVVNIDAHDRAAVDAGPAQCHANSGCLKDDHLGNKDREDEPRRHAKTRRWPRLNCTDWMAGQLEGRQQEEGTRRSNPRPQGVSRPGSGTDVLLRFLRQAPGRWVFHSERVLSGPQQGGN